MKHWLLILFMLWIGAGGTQPYSVSIIEDDVIISNSFPDWGTICITSDVRGGPDESYPFLYSVLVGKVVRIHDQSRPDGTWVSIGVAEWLPLKNLCE